MLNMRRITIILICTKRPTELFLRSLESLRIQNNSNFNLLFINNGNCPEVKAILEMSEFSHLNIDYYTEEKILYPGYLRIKYAKKVKTPYCAFLDDDDKFYPETIEYLNGTIQEYKDKPVAFFQFGIWYNPTGYRIVASQKIYIEEDRLSFLEKKNTLDRITTHNWNKLYKTEFISQLNEKDYDNILYLEDGCIILDILKQCEQENQDIVLLDKILYTYFQDPNAQTRKGGNFKTKKKALDGIFAFIKKLNKEQFYTPLEATFIYHIIQFSLQEYNISLFHKIKIYFYLLWKILPFYNLFNKNIPKFKRTLFKESLLFFFKEFYNNIFLRLLAKLANFYHNIAVFFVSPFIKEDKNQWIIHSRFFKDMNINLFLSYASEQTDVNIKQYIIYEYQKEKHNLIRGKNIYYISIFNPKLPLILAKSHKIFLMSVSKSLPLQYFMKKKFCIQLWHGIPIKNIGYLVNGHLETFKYQYAYYNFLVSSSQSDRLAMSLAFSPDKPEKVHITGLPRNDLILQPDDQKIPEPYRYHTQIVRKEGKRDKKVILYAPTWRDPRVFKFNKESFQHYSPNLNELAQLKQLLQKHNACIFFKPHGITQMFGQEIFPLYDNEFFIDYKWVDINVLIRLADIMISDYSSTSLDFMLTEKPIIHFNYDMEIYNAERGFIYNKESIFPGEQTQTFEGLLELLDKQLTQPSISEHYKYLRTFFHQYTDTNNSQRIMELLKIV